ncbi:zinc-binding dehydrogenase-domain-containing protein [Aspergillus recurvatus]
MHLTVTCSTTKISLCESLGADDVIDHRTQDVASMLNKRGRGFSLVVDYAYRDEANLYIASDNLITQGGKFVMVPGGLSGKLMQTACRNMLCPFVLGGGRAKFEVYFAKNNRAGFEHIAEWMAAGQVRTVIDTVYGFGDMPKAIQKIKSGTATEKIVVRA